MNGRVAFEPTLECLSLPGQSQNSMKQTAPFINNTGGGEEKARFAL
jgi:hypothetical protein